MAKKRRMRKSGYFKSKETSTEEQTKAPESKEKAASGKKNPLRWFSPKKTKE